MWMRNAAFFAIAAALSFPALAGDDTKMMDVFAATCMEGLENGPDMLERIKSEGWSVAESGQVPTLDRMSAAFDKFLVRYESVTGLVQEGQDAPLLMLVALGGGAQNYNTCTLIDTSAKAPVDPDAFRKRFTSFAVRKYNLTYAAFFADETADPEPAIPGPDKGRPAKFNGIAGQVMSAEGFGRS